MKLTFPLYLFPSENGFWHALWIAQYYREEKRHCFGNELINNPIGRHSFFWQSRNIVASWSSQPPRKQSNEFIWKNFEEKESVFKVNDFILFSNSTTRGLLLYLMIWMWWCDWNEKLIERECKNVFSMLYLIHHLPVRRHHLAFAIRTPQDKNKWSVRRRWSGLFWDARFLRGKLNDHDKNRIATAVA